MRKITFPQLLLGFVLIVTFVSCKKKIETPAEDLTENPTPPPTTINIEGTTWTSVSGCQILPQRRIKALATVENRLLFTFIDPDHVSGRYDGINFFFSSQSPLSFGSGSGIEKIQFSEGIPYGLGSFGGNGVLSYTLGNYYAWEEVSSGGLFTLGTNGFSVVDYDGNKLVACGSAPYIRTETSWDWTQFGVGLNAAVADMLVLNGELIVAGGFDEDDDGTVLNHVAKWSNGQWVPLGEGLNGSVSDLVVFNNQIIAIGNFSASGAGNTSCSYVAAWNGNTWEELDGGLSGGFSGGFVGLAFDNQLFIGGDFDLAGGQASKNIAKWNGNNWESLPGIDQKIGDIAVYNGKLYAVNAFEIANENFLLRLD